MSLIPYRSKKNASLIPLQNSQEILSAKENHRSLFLKSLATNPEQRCLAVAVVDVSGSMSGRPIEEVNCGLKIFGDELKADRTIAENTVVSVITFGQEVRIAVAPTPASEFVAPELIASGQTPLAEGVDLAVREIRKTQVLLNELGIDQAPVQFLLISDGYPTSCPEDLAKASSDFRMMTKAGGVTPILVATENGNAAYLKQLFGVDAITLDGLRYRRLFAWYYRSVTHVSMRCVECDFTPLDPHQSNWAK